MPYLRKNKNTSGELKKNVLVLFLLFLILFFGEKQKDIIRYKSAILTTYINISLKESVEKINSFFYIFYSKNKLVSENNDLKKQLEIKDQSLYLLNKNHQLKMSELQSTLEDGEKNDYIIGFLISKAPSLPFGYAMVNVGYNQGIERGKPAIYQGFLVGKVEYVSNDYSLIKFFGNDKESKKLLVGTARIIRTGEGNGNGSYLVEMPKDAETKSGEVVRLSEFPNYIFGETVLAGTLGNAEKKMFFAESPVNYFEVPFVKILK